MDYSDIDRRLKALIDRPASNHLLSHISHQASLVIPCHHTTEHYKSPIPPLPTFVNLLARRSSARTGTLLASLVLLDRLRQRLAQFARGMPCTCQRIFLATLIVTTKLLHDTSPKNKHWTKYAVYFTLPEVNLMEKQLLALMNYQLFITEKDMYYTFITYDNTTALQLPPILPDRDRHYLPKSASFNSPSCSITYSNSSLSNVILHQQQQYQYQYQHQYQHHHYNNNSKNNNKTIPISKTKKSSSNNRKVNNTKRLNISTSSSSSSLSSCNSMDDLLVVTPTNDNTNINMMYNCNNNSIIPTSSLSSSNLVSSSKKHFHLNTNSSIMWLDPMLPYHHHSASNIIFKH